MVLSPVKDSSHRQENIHTVSISFSSSMSSTQQSFKTLAHVMLIIRSQEQPESVINHATITVLSLEWNSSLF